MLGNFPAPNTIITVMRMSTTSATLSVLCCLGMEDAPSIPEI